MLLLKQKSKDRNEDVAAMDTKHPECSVSDDKRSQFMQRLPWKRNAKIALIVFLCWKEKEKKKEVESVGWRAIPGRRCRILYSLMPF